MESPGAYLHARRLSGSELLSFGAAGAATALLLTGTGDAFVAVALLGAAALDVVSFGLAAGAFAAVLVRWGSGSLSAAAGVQAVLGPAIAVGPIAGAASSGAAAIALICAAPAGITAVPFGVAAAVVAAGPAATSPTRLALRVVACIVGVLAAWLVTRRVPTHLRQRAGLAAAVVAIALGLVA